jgi:hypothetical protein
VALFVLIWDFETVLTVWHYLSLYGTLELFRLYGIICFSIKLWNSSNSVASFVFLLDFGTVPTVWQNKECHTVGTVPKSNRKTNNVTLWE